MAGQAKHAKKKKEKGALTGHPEFSPGASSSPEPEAEERDRLLAELLGDSERTVGKEEPKAAEPSPKPVPSWAEPPEADEKGSKSADSDTERASAPKKKAKAEPVMREGRKRPRKAVLLSLLAVVACLAVAAVFFLGNGGAAALSGLFSGGGQPVSVDEPVESPPQDPVEEPEEPEPEEPVADPVFRRPDQMKGAFLLPGTDFLLSGEETAEEVKTQIDSALSQVQEWGFNTVLVPMRQGNTALYSSTLFDSISFEEEEGFGPLTYLLEQARDKELYVYGIWDMNAGTWDPSTAEGAEKIRQASAEAAAAFPADGFLLDNYSYPAGQTADYASYLQQAAGIGLAAYARDSVTRAVRETVASFRAADPDIYVGLLAGSVWASQEDRPDAGIAVSGWYGELTDGGADTRAWVRQGLFDFVMAENYVALENEACSFQSVLDWWGEVCTGAGVPLYISHDAQQAVSEDAGWNSPDQLSRQVLACQQSAAWSGSAFLSLSALQENPLNSTDVLLQTLAGQVQSEYISNKLVITSPSRQTTTTGESLVVFQGSADPNFPLLLNGEEVELSEHGYFALEKTLSIGKNTFAFSHKNQTVTYVVNYVVEVLKSVSPSENLALEGGTVITISAIAHKDSTVYATVNGQTVAMKPTPLQSNENDGQQLTDYENYSGEFTFPDGIVGQAQDLGTVTVYGQYLSLSETRQGGRLTVNAVEPPPPEDPELPSGGGGPVDPGNGGDTLATGRILTITTNYAETFSGETTDDYSRPTNAYLPKGTTDVLVKSVYDSASKNYYYLLGCGRRVYQRDAQVYQENGRISANTLTTGGVTVSGGYTQLEFQSLWHVPYNLQLLPQSYLSISGSGQPDYGITSFTAQYVEITFSYTPSVTGTPDVSGSPLFSRAEWLSDGSQSVLRLYLKETGGFYGYSVVWEEDGSLRFSFKHAPGSQSLAGKRIVIDPGHGGSHVGTAAGNVTEKSMTLKYALALRDKLESLGATVTLTRTGDSHLASDDHDDLVARADMARNNGTDLFISLHMDGSTSSTANGSSVHYFNEYSYEASVKVAAQMQAVYDSYNPGGQKRGARWDPFLVTRIHDCPAMLVECGFLTTPSNLELLINDSFMNDLAAAIASGIQDYFQSQPVSRTALAAFSVPLPDVTAGLPEERAV